VITFRRVLQAARRGGQKRRRKLRARYIRVQRATGLRTAW
jgi:hypothetical protein